MKYCFWIILLLAFNGWLSCGGSGGTGQENEKPADSQMVAEHVDPSTKFPQQVVEADTLQTDAQFVGNAVQSAQETLILAELALQKATRQEVKDIAQGISRDFRQLHSDLQKLQRRKGATDSVKTFTDGSQETLEGLSGTAFDQQWIEKMVTRNNAAISRYQAESAAARDRELKKLVDGVLPKLKTYQQQLETCRDKLR